MSVLVLVHMRGNTDKLLAASDRLAETFGMPAGLSAHVTAPTDEGIVLMQVWDSEEHRRQANEDPRNRDALQASGLLRVTLSGSAEVYESRPGSVRRRGGRPAAAPQAHPAAQGRDSARRYDVTHPRA